VKIRSGVFAKGDLETPCGGVLEGVAEEITEEYEQDFAVAVHDGFRRYAKQGFQPAMGKKKLLLGERFAHEFRQRLRAALRATAILAGHDKKSAGDALQPPRGTLEACEQFRTRKRFLLHKTERPTEHSERRAQLMRTVSNELPFALKSAAFPVPCFIECPGQLGHFIRGPGRRERAVVRTA
jgi:hypothetical protein